MATILQINVCNGIYSTGKIASDIGELAISKGWNSYIAYQGGGYYRQSKNTPIKIGNKLDHYLHAFESRLLDNQGLGCCSKRGTKQLIKEIKRISPSIIHLHVIHGYYLNLRVLFEYLKTIQTPIVWTIHSCWEFTGHCCYFDSIGCEKWKTGCFNCPKIKSYPKSWFLDRSRRNYIEKKELFGALHNLTLVPVSKWLGNLLKESFLKKYPIAPIYNGVDIEVFKPNEGKNVFREKYGLSSEFIAIGVASTWEPRKNLDDYKRLSQIVPNNVKIVLVGLTNKDQDDLPSGILGLPRTKTIQELVDIYCAADVVLNLSLEETFGLTTVEGFACGTPGIVYDRTASPELISNDTGFVVEAGDVEGVSHCILEIASKGKRFYSENCRRRAVSLFDKNKNYEQYIELYNNLLNNVSV